MEKSSVVYVAMSADLIHHGHVNIINIAAKLGPVVVGILTDEAMISYKRKPINNWYCRKTVMEAMKGVVACIPQDTLDYVPNLMTLRPSYVVHGSDWKEGVQSETRQRVIECLSKWGGELVEPEYTKGISTTDLIKRCNSSEKRE